MNTDDGRIYTLDEIKRMQNEDQELPAKFKLMEIDPTPQQMNRKPPRVGRNDPCPCGSMKKFKKCCYTGGHL